MWVHDRGAGSCSPKQPRGGKAESIILFVRQRCWGANLNGIDSFGIVVRRVDVSPIARCLLAEPERFGGSNAAEVGISVCGTAAKAWLLKMIQGPVVEVSLQQRPAEFVWQQQSLISPDQGWASSHLTPVSRGSVAFEGHRLPHRMQKPVCSQRQMQAGLRTSSALFCLVWSVALWGLGGGSAVRARALFPGRQQLGRTRGRRGKEQPHGCRTPALHAQRGEAVRFAQRAAKILTRL